MTVAKTSHNPCPICGKPRGKGPYEFAHGLCAEKRAAKATTDGKQKAGLPGHFSSLTVEQVEKGKRNRVAKQYVTGKKLPGFMFS